MMRTRKDILSSLPQTCLRRLAGQSSVVIPARATKAVCVEALVNSSHTTIALLERLTAKDVSQLCRALKVTVAKRTKTAMIESIVGTSPQRLRRNVVQSLKQLGFSFIHGKPQPPGDEDKEKIRRLHAAAVCHRRDRSRPSLVRKEAFLLTHFASGREVSIERFEPRLVEVE